MPPRKAVYLKPSKPHIMIHGKPDTDKTKFGLEFPNAVYIDSEGGAVESQYVKSLNDHNSLYMGIADGSQNLSEIIEEVKKLLKSPGDRQSLILDSVTKVVDVTDSEEQEKMGDKKDPFSSYKKKGVRYMKRLVALLGQLDMNVVLIAHSRDKWEGEGENRKVAGTTFDGWTKLGHDINLQAEALRVGAVTFMRVVRSKYEAIIRGQEIPMTYDAFAKAYGKDIIERKPEAIIPATPEQVEEILKLTGILRMDEEELSGWLTKAKAEEIQDLSKDNAAKFIVWLEKKRKGETA